MTAGQIILLVVGFFLACASVLFYAAGIYWESRAEVTWLDLNGRERLPWYVRLSAWIIGKRV